VLGLIAFGDRIEDGAPEAAARLKATGITPIMLTGDNAGVARAVAGGARDRTLRGRGAARGKGAGAAMALSSVSVVTNALPLRGWRPAPQGLLQDRMQGAQAPQPQGGNPMYELTVEGMSCGHCVGRVTKTVQGLDEHAKVEIDLPTRKVRIDSRADLEQIAAAIDEAGYPVTARSVA
jgi:cation transport ATPase